MIRLLILTRSLGNGGAERQLAELARLIDKDRFDVTIATFYPGGPRWADILSVPSVRLTSLNKRGRWDLYGAWRSAFKLLKQNRTDIIYGYREEGNLLALSLARVAGVKLVWSIRRSTKTLPRDLVAVGIFGLGAAFSRLADKVIYNSACGRDIYTGRGYYARNAVVVSNGFDTMRFRPDPDARKKQRNAWGIDDGETLIGIVGRLDPVKDHPLFLETASIMARTHKNARFVAVGGGSDRYKNALQDKAGGLGLADRVLWAGESGEMVGVYNALDILALCSKEEGCPNVVGEAMACGVPCVVTDVGDAALMVGDTGLVVPRANPAAMAAAWGRLLALPPEVRYHIGISACNRITREYSLKTMVEHTSSILEGIVNKPVN